ncbi:glycosyltransferase family 2 protein [Congregibacter variabilis]|uniref:Glycosyltransferase family 2 protein n=1 Tax=Congregibacter variabilis TaxID=3081200 RepID=A0ABZ0I725_9GAMM|nr:glycosyltransferase family 2 protein [Congregibacter sp. IMCC43200]
MNFDTTHNSPPAVSVSVITVAFNCIGTLPSTLESVKLQSLPNVEHIVIDGASTDGTTKFLEERRGQLSALISEPDDGIYDALNKGIEVSSGDVIGFLHADDVFGSNDVLTEVAEKFKDSSVQAVYGDLQYVHFDNLSSIVRHWKSGPFSRARLVRGWMPPHPTLYVRREWYERIGGFDTKYRIAADYLSILQMFSAPHFKVAYIPKVLVKMRVGGVSNRSIRNILRKSYEDYQALRETGVGGLGTLFAKNLSKLNQFFYRKN